VAIYTKTGDKGKTGTFSGKRISKSSELINAIGAIDELNSFLGIIGGLTEIQRNLFTINSILTGAKLELPRDEIRKLEREIDKWEGSMPVLKNFIIYSGSKKATQIFFARSLTRRAERSLINLNIKSQKLEVLAYINRLSDYLFMLARFTNFRSKISEKIWKA
jgi:cob(I)alamin adenosyltransferase